MKSTPSSALTVALALSLASLTLASSCYTRCRFRFCDGSTVFDPKAYAPDTPFTGPICDKYGKIHVGAVDESGEALVRARPYYGKHFVPISKYYPHGLKQHFTPSFFKTYSIPGHYTLKHGLKYYSPYHKYDYYTPHKYSGVGHETSQQGQIHFLNNKCIILPLKKYQVLDKYGRYVIDNVNTHNVYHDCVAFKVQFRKYPIYY